MEFITIKKNKVGEYVRSLTEIEKLAMEIAKKHLGSSFDIKKSNGFIQLQRLQIHDQHKV